jgi:hypothetical protein
VKSEGDWLEYRKNITFCSSPSTYLENNIYRLLQNFTELLMKKASGAGNAIKNDLSSLIRKNSLA